MSTLSIHAPAAVQPDTTEPVVIAPLTMRDAQRRMVTTFAFLSFALSALASYFTGGSLGEAIGVGAFVAFWIGGGFGVIMGGALYAHHNEATLYNR